MHTHELQAMALHPNGMLLATGDASRSGDCRVSHLVLWDLHRLEPVAEKTFENDTGVGWSGIPECIQFSPSGRTLVAVHNTNQLVFLAAPSLGELGSNCMSDNDGPPDFILASDDTYLYGYGETYAISTRVEAYARQSTSHVVLDAGHGAFLIGMGPSDSVVAILSPDEYDFYSRGRDHYSLALIDTRTWQVRARVAPRFDVDNSLPDEGFALDRTGCRLAYMTPELLQVVDTQNGAALQRRPLENDFRICSPLWSPDSRRIVYFHGDGLAWIEEDTETAVACKSPCWEMCDGSVWAWHPESDGAAFVEEDDHVVRLDRALDRILWRSEAFPDIEAVVWSANDIVATGARSLRTLDPATGLVRRRVAW